MNQPAATHALRGLEPQVGEWTKGLRPEPDAALGGPGGPRVRPA